MYWESELEPTDFSVSERDLLWQHFSNALQEDANRHFGVFSQDVADEMLSLLFEKIGNPFEQPSPELLEEWRNSLLYSIPAHDSNQKCFFTEAVRRSQPLHDSLFRHYKKTGSHPISNAVQRNQFDLVALFLEWQPSLLQNGFRASWDDDSTYTADDLHPLDWFVLSSEGFGALKALNYNFSQRYTSPSALSLDESAAALFMMRPVLADRTNARKDILRRFSFAEMPLPDDLLGLMVGGTLDWERFNDEAWIEPFLSAHYRQQYAHPLCVALYSLSKGDFRTNQENMDLFQTSCERLIPLLRRAHHHSENDTFFLVDILVKTILSAMQAPDKFKFALFKIFSELQPLYDTPEMALKLVERTSSFQSLGSHTPLTPIRQSSLAVELLSCGPSLGSMLAVDAKGRSAFDILLSAPDHPLSALPSLLCEVELSKLRGNADHGDFSNASTRLQFSQSQYDNLLLKQLSSKRFEPFDFIHLIQHATWPPSIPLTESLISTQFGSDFCKKEYANIQSLALRQSVHLSAGDIDIIKKSKKAL